jgi:hypothetical protein
MKSMPGLTSTLPAADVFDSPPLGCDPDAVKLFVGALGVRCAVLARPSRLLYLQAAAVFDAPLPLRGADAVLLGVCCAMLCGAAALQCSRPQSADATSL